MAEKETKEVESVFTVQDQAAAALDRIAKSADRLGGGIDRAIGGIGRMTGLLGGLGITFGIQQSFSLAKGYFETIDRITKVTGMAANETAGMAYAMEQAGIAGMATERVMIDLAQRQDDIARGNKQLARDAKRYGVDLKQGPEKVLISMADAVGKGKLGSGELIRFMSISKKEAASMMDLLQDGPDHVAKMMEIGRQKMGHINEATLAAFDSMDKAQVRVKQAWTRITTIVAAKMFPVVEKLVVMLEERIDSWADAANRFGNFLSDHLNQAIVLAKTFGKIMLANALLMKFTGAGIFGNIGKIGKFATGGGAGAMFKQMASPGIKERPITKIMGAFTMMMLRLEKAGSVLKMFLTGAFSLMPIAKMLLRLTVVGAVISVIVAAIQRLMNNVGGIRDRLQELLGDIWSNVKRIGDQLGKIFGSSSPFGKLLSALGGGLLKVVEFLLQGVNELLKLTADFLYMVRNPLKSGLTLGGARQQRLGEENAGLAQKFNKANVGSMDLYRIQQETSRLANFKGKIGQQQRAEFAALRERQKAVEALTGSSYKGMDALAARYAPDQRQKQVVHQDFRGSKFEITQAFSDGFDPDRIAVAFASDLASLGERKLQSGFAPIFAVR